MADSAAAAVPPVYSKEEIYRYVDLGLGRGVDGTDPTPWLNKTSFQVRIVKFENIVGTDEGSSLQSYEQEVSSVRTQQTKMKSSVTIPKSPVAIGTEAEFSRSVHSSRRSIGRKIINRTISFRDNFDDVPFGEETAESSILTKDGQNLQTFEERLSTWLLEHLKLGWQEESETTEGFVTPLELSQDKTNTSLRDLSTVIEKKRQADMKIIADGCQKFVEYFRITHYVSSIQLGATEYQVMTQEEYNTALSIAGKANVQGIGEVETKQSMSVKKKIGSKERKHIGRISSDNKVARGSQDEAVVNVGIRPITTIIKTAFLNACMQKALTEYMEAQSDKSDGPFLISCGVGQLLYLSINPLNNAVMATSDVARASEFYIIPNDSDKSGSNEFYIVYNKPNDLPEPKDDMSRRYSILTDTTSDTNSVAFYLRAPVNIWGENPGPLYVCDTVQQKTSRFALNERVMSDSGSNPIALDAWINGSDMFYVNCSRRAFRRDGYLAVKKVTTAREGSMYHTACTGDVSYHDNSNVWMLFRLIAARQCIETEAQHLSAPQEKKKSASIEEIPSTKVVEKQEEDIEMHEL